MTGTGLVVFDLRVLAVGHFGQEDARVSLRVKRLLLLGNLDLRLVVGTWSRVLAWRELLVLDINGWFKDLALVF